MNCVHPTHENMVDFAPWLAQRSMILGATSLPNSLTGHLLCTPTVAPNIREARKSAFDSQVSRYLTQMLEELIEVVHHCCWPRRCTTVVDSIRELGKVVMMERERELDVCAN